MVTLGRRRPPAEELRDLYRANVRSVYAYFSYLLSADVAEDLTAITFERVVRYWGKYDPARGGARQWVLAIARHVFADHVRAAARERSSVSLDEFPDLRDERATYEPAGAHQESIEELTALLTTLNPRQREVVALRYGAALTPAEIAAHLGISETNVYQILSRSLRRLREELTSRQDDSVEPAAGRA
jgi:RNA polymerase sigma-70 factor (ECF subfamily)